ncbi:ATP-binding protein [Novosphingobium nitrogenifigens]|uniref:ATP-binding protein n=1 Tax=Novosphingobium nitrogenifigens TaxID=378548 RepID=UPI000AEBD3C2|nr:ATP-binding protein [Novosphingobium nitrogenifigens]
MGWFDKFTSRKNEHEEAPSYSQIAAPAPAKAKDRKSLFPRFQSSATDELRGMRGGPDQMARVKLRDAFTPAQPVADIRHMAGRRELINSLIRSLEDQRLHVVLYGERGIGKTSLLRVLAELAHDAQYIVRYKSCGEGSDFSDLMRGVASTIPLLYHADYDPATLDLDEGKSLASLLPAGSLSADDIGDVFARLSGTRVLIILDEFDRSPRGVFRRSIAELIKNLSDRSVRVQLVIAGVASNLSELVDHIPSIRRNVLGLHVPVLDGGEIRELLAIGEEMSGIEFTDAAVGLISSFSCGSPYLASLLGQLSGLAAIDRGSRTIESEDIARGVHVAVEEISQRMSERTTEKVDRVFAQNKGAALVRLARIAMLHGGRLDTVNRGQEMEGVEECRHAIDDLAGLDSGLIIPSEDGVEGRYQFSEEGLPTYIWMLVARERVESTGFAGGGTTTA